MNEPPRVENAHLHIEQIDGLVAAAGVDGTREILDAFWRSTTNLMEQLTEQVSQNTLDLAAQTAHAVKGSAANIGALRLSNTATEFENACKRADLDAAKTALQSLQQDYIDVKGHFEEHLSKA
ncbi:MAG: Hpt domain-containing protein [Marinicaulis sp.]|nr:Hpt domain-containing protein [Marinicaulis sp.]